MKQFVKKNWGFSILLVAFAVYSTIYIYQTSFVFHGQRYFVLFDDAMISMRYAHNLARGYGLVWNPGEYVEGFTNLLWVVYMSLFHLLPIPASKVSLFIQVSGALFLGASLFFVRRIGEEISGSHLVGLLAVVMTAFYYPLVFWSELGMEVSVLVLILSGAAWWAIRMMKTGRFSPWLWILMGISTLIRMDMAVPFLILLGFLVVFDPQNRKRHLLWGAGSFVFFLAGQTLFRVLYYGDPLPNTYYLKMAGYPIYQRVARGLYVLVKLIWNMNWILFLLPFIVLLFKLDRPTALLALVFLGQVAYSVYVGGDAWEHKGGANRYISTAIPLYFVLFAYAADILRQALLRLRERMSGGMHRLSQFGLVGLVIFSLVNFNALLSPTDLRRWLLVAPPLFTAGNEEYAKEGVILNEITRPGARLAVIAAGSIPYFSDRYALDLLGKSDAYIAHLKPNLQPGLAGLVDYRPGHDKWDYDYTIGKLKPDVIIHLWGDTSMIRAQLDSEYVWVEIEGYPFYLLKDSPYIQWDRVPSN